MTSQGHLAVWTRRPTTAVARLAGRPLLLLSARDLLRAAREEGLLTVAFAAPAGPAMAGFARAARDCGAPLFLVRPSGSADEAGPQESRDDVAFVEAAMKAADELAFRGPMALIKEPPRSGCAVPERDRVFRELEAGFTGLGIAARVDDTAGARDAALSAAQVCQLGIGLEVIPVGGSPRLGVEIVSMLRARGAPPSALRLTGHEAEAAGFASALQTVAVTTAAEGAPETLHGLGVHQLFAAGPFLRALRRAAPAALWDKLQAWSDDQQATLEQSASRHQRLLRELTPEQQDKLEALCCFEAEELLRRAGAAGTSDRLSARVGSYVEQES